MDDILKALTDFSADGQASTDNLEENADIIKALTDLSAVSDSDITTTLDNDVSLATNVDQANVVTISYTQVNSLHAIILASLICWSHRTPPIRVHLTQQINY